MSTNTEIKKTSASTWTTFYNWAKALDQALDYDRVEFLDQKVAHLEGSVRRLETDAVQKREKINE